MLIADTLISQIINLVNANSDDIRQISPTFH